MNLIVKMLVRFQSVYLDHANPQMLGLCHRDVQEQEEQEEQGQQGEVEVVVCHPHPAHTDQSALKLISCRLRHGPIYVF